MSNQTPDQMCSWKEDIDGMWDTDCGEAFMFEAAGPKENGMRFCCYCGKKLGQATYCTEREAEMMGDDNE